MALSEPVIDRIKKPRFVFLVWGLSSLAVWGLVCLYALIFRYSLLETGLVPWEIILGLALVPIAVVALIVQIFLFLALKYIRPLSGTIVYRLVVLGTPLFTCLLVILLILSAGGLGSFVPRL